MATPSFALSMLLLFLAMPYPSLSCPTTCECEINLQLYLHQVVHGQPNQTQVVTHAEVGGFGSQVVVDYAVIDAIRPNPTIVARAKGMLVAASIGASGSGYWFNYFSVEFQDARFTGSTLQVMGNLHDVKDGQMAIVGGTGEFVSAHGVIKYKKVRSFPNVESYREFNISAFYAPTTGYTCGTAIL